MIGRFAIDSPPIDDSLLQMVESHRSKTGQDYAAILFFGLWGTADCSPEIRLYAAYRHLEANPEDGPAWVETSRVHLEADEPDASEKILDELLRLECPGLYPTLYSEDPRALRAHVLADSGRLDEALDALDQIRVRHGESPVYHYTVGTVLHEKNDFAAAGAAYAEALEQLEAFRLEVNAEGAEEDIDVDFVAAADFLKAAVRRAEAETPFAGTRPIDLSGFREDLE